MPQNILVQGIRSLNDLGLADVLLPFLLIFTIMFAVLQKTKVLGKTDDGKPQKNFNVIIALIIGLLVVIPHVTLGTLENKYDAKLAGTNFPDVVEVINNALPQISVIAVLIIMVMMLIGILGPEINIAGTPLAGVVAVISFIVVVLIFLASAGILGGYNLPGWLDFLNDDTNRGMILVILMFGLLVWFIISEPKEKDEKSAFEKLGEMLSAGGKK